MPSMLNTAAVAALVGAVNVAAHGHVSSIVVDGETYEGFDPTSAPYLPSLPDSIAWSNGATDNGFVASSDVANPDVICHIDAGNAALSAEAAAGSNVSITWNTWPETHYGPVIDYMADCGGDCATVDKTSLKWFKVQEMGQLSLGSSGTPGKWADDLIVENSFTWDATIPASLKPGNYVWRHEIIALHSAGSEGGAQLYPQCFNLKVTGSGSQSPEGTVGTSLYTPTDAGIMYNIYNDESKSAIDYQIPGPAMPAFDGSSSSSGSGSGAAPAASTTAAPVASTTAAAQATTVVEAAPSSTTAAAAAPTHTSKCKSRKARRQARALKNAQ
ncbi:lytic polysaccharide monooxygenase [Xylariomycetidae sp. FL0641]|nr:lytic polysaccharide monooxygenase [Xylariomycetidae sp. FL0641]